MLLLHIRSCQSPYPGLGLGLCTGGNRESAVESPGADSGPSLDFCASSFNKCSLSMSVVQAARRSCIVAAASSAHETFRQPPVEWHDLVTDTTEDLPFKEDVVGHNRGGEQRHCQLPPIQRS